VAASLFSRNLVLAARPDAGDRLRLRTARLGVVLFGIVAWLLARGADGVFALVEDASGFGSAGILVVVAFGLFGRGWSAASAHAALWAGVLVWIAGHYLGLGPSQPYLASLAAALAAFLIVGGCARARRAALASRA
jgi:Na+/proline symporter